MFIVDLNATIVFAHADVTTVISPPYWITASGLYPHFVHLSQLGYRTSEANSTSLCQKLVAIGIGLVSFREDCLSQVQKTFLKIKFFHLPSKLCFKPMA